MTMRTDIHPFYLPSKWIDTVLHNPPLLHRGLRLCVFFLLCLSMVHSDVLEAKEKGDKRPPPLVTVTPVLQQAVIPTLNVVGQVHSRLRATVATQVAGLVARVSVEPGDRVNAGSTLIEIDQDSIDHTLAILKAELAESRARLDKAQKDLARDRKLAVSHSVSKRQLTESEAALAIQHAEVAQVKARINQSHFNRDNHTVIAPFDGVVIERLTAPGAWLDRGDPVVILMNPTALEVTTPIPAHYAQWLKEGVTAEATLQGDQSTLLLTSRAVLPDVDLNSRNRQVFWTINTPDQRLIAGNEIRVNVPISDPEPALLVDKDAVLMSGNNPRVFVLEGDSVTMKPVTLGKAYKTWFRIQSGLEPGMQVVIKGNERLLPNQKVRIDANQESTP
ncbi:MAG: efflux RND transporter periplasmic adaptor subunit [Magnetococcales bacterium]|nr:efflux RND transporter periplasmic adaptor subunit [Magnetococcales bacterium]